MCPRDIPVKDILVGPVGTAIGIIVATLMYGLACIRIHGTSDGCDSQGR